MKPLNIFGLIIFSIGVLALAGFGLYKSVGPFFRNVEIPAIIKFGVTALILGVIIILISLIFERVRDKKEEK